MMKERKQKILKESIDNYIKSAEPVSSKALADWGNLGVSSATIRQELKELEDEGYLTHLHTSSGRVPTNEGYRYYVNSLINPGKMSSGELKNAMTHFEAIQLNISDSFKQISEIMSSMINYTTIVMMPSVFQETIKLLHMVMIDLNRVLVVLLNSLGVNKEFIMSIDQSLNQDELNKLSQFISEKIEGQNIESIDQETFEGLIQALPQYNILLQNLFNKVSVLCQENKSKQDILFSGTSKMLKLPEFKDIEFTQQVLQTLEENKVLSRILNASLIEKKSHAVLIGKEDHTLNELDGCSLVLSPVSTGHNSKAMIGVLGPKRMAYQDVLTQVSTVTELINGHYEKVIN